MKTTGVSDIPKFGLLVLLGHPIGHINTVCNLHNFVANLALSGLCAFLGQFWPKFCGLPPPPLFGKISFFRLRPSFLVINESEICKQVKLSKEAIRVVCFDAFVEAG